MSEIGGVYAAAITPRRKGSTEIDLAAGFEMIDFLSAHKVNGIVLMGTTGEFVHFTIEERQRFAHLAIKRSRVPVAVNVSHSTLDGSIALARQAAISNAAALLLMPPYFFRYSQTDIFDFFQQFAAEVDPRVPLLLYNIPLFTNPIEAATAEELLLRHRYHGIKDSSGIWNNIETLTRMRERKPFTLMVGSDELYSRAAALGVSGVISGCACAIPELLVGLHRALHAEAPELVTRLEMRLQQFVQWLNRLPVPVGIREAAALRGIRTGTAAVPPGREQEAALEEFRQWFRDWLPRVQHESAHAAGV